jgi:hypothetical protein
MGYVTDVYIPMGAMATMTEGRVGRTKGEFIR